MTASKFAIQSLSAVVKIMDESGLGSSKEMDRLLEVMDQLTGWCSTPMRLGPSICSACNNDNTDYRSDDWAS